MLDVEQLSTHTLHILDDILLEECQRQRKLGNHETSEELYKLMGQCASELEDRLWGYQE